MTTATDIFRTEGVLRSDRDDRAQRAVKAFRALQPALNAYARVLTKKRDVRVEMSSRDNGSTDGTKIYFRPPIGLGDKTDHQRRLCDKRDERLQHLCEACRIREKVLTTIYHEIAHICFDSFAQTSEQDKQEVLKAAIAEHGSKYAKLLEKRIAQAPYRAKNSYIGLAGLISEFLPLLVNCLEDARVNAELFKARKGTKVMFTATSWKTFTEGVEQRNAEGEIVTIKWSDYPLNMQIMVGIFCKISGYEYQNWFVPEVIEALGDRELTTILSKMHTIRTAKGTYELAFPVLARLRELGFCQLPDDPDQPEPEESDEDDSVSDSDESSSGGSDASDESDVRPGDADDEGEAGGGAPRESSSSGGDDAGGSGTESGTGPSAGDAASDDDGGAGSGGSDSEEAGDAEADPAENGDGNSSESKDEGDGNSTDGGDGSDVDEDATGEDSSSAGDPSADLAGGEPVEGEADADSSEPSEPDSGEPVDGEPSDAGSGSGDQALGEDDRLPDDQAGASTGDDESDQGEDDRSSDEGDPQSGDADSEPASPVDKDDELIDTGADKGKGGITVEGEVEYGTPEEVKAGLEKWGGHEDKPLTAEALRDDEAVQVAIMQGAYFEMPSSKILGVREHFYGKPIIEKGVNFSRSWDKDMYDSYGYTHRALGIEGDFHAPESVLGPALLRMRIAFADNARGKDVYHLKSGKINGKVLGKRAPGGDERLFRKKIVPGKRDYFVLLGLDISGSTIGRNITLIKAAAMAQAELLARMGIKFAIYAHSGNLSSSAVGAGWGSALDLDIYHVKDPDEPWDPKIQERLQALGPDSANLDGHSLEYYRKRCDERPESDKVILYYSDGKMPAENFSEELEILQREIRICRQKKYTLLGVGIRTDSPRQHGLDTVQVDELSEIGLVVKHLEKVLK